MKRLIVAAFAVACLAAGSAQAQQASPPPVAATVTPSPKALALTKRYIAALHVDQTMKPMMQSMMGPMLDEQERANPNLTDAQRKAIRETVQEFVGGDMMDDILERMTPAYATIFSEDELQALVDFYESPTGQSIIGKMPQMGPVAAKVMVEIMPEIRVQLAQRICQKLGCGKAQGPKSKQS
jgi:hypothetical protein